MALSSSVQACFIMGFWIGRILNGSLVYLLNICRNKFVWVLSMSVGSCPSVSMGLCFLLSITMFLDVLQESGNEGAA